MCVTVPREVIRVDGDRAEVLVDGQSRVVVCAGLDGLQPGDFVLLHADAAIERLSPEEARETLDFIAAMEAMLDDPESFADLLGTSPAPDRAANG